MEEEGPIDHEVSGEDECRHLPQQVPRETRTQLCVERAKWWTARLNLAEGEFQWLIEQLPELATTKGVGYYEDGPNIVIFVAGKEVFVWDLIDTWLHEYLEVEFAEEVDNHEAFDSTVTRVAKYVSSP